MALSDNITEGLFQCHTATCTTWCVHGTFLFSLRCNTANASVPLELPHQYRITESNVKNINLLLLLSCYVWTISIISSLLSFVLYHVTIPLKSYSFCFLLSIIGEADFFLYNNLDVLEGALQCTMTVSRLCPSLMRIRICSCVTNKTLFHSFGQFSQLCQNFRRSSSL